MPFELSDARSRIEETRKNEERVGKPVEVYLQPFRRTVISRFKSADPALCPAANRPGNMRQSGTPASAWENERCQRRKLAIHLVDPILEVGCAPSLCVVLHTPPWIGQQAARREKRLLNNRQTFANTFRKSFTFEQSDQRAQLVDCAVSLNESIVLAHPSARVKRSLALVTCAGIYLHPFILLES